MSKTIIAIIIAAVIIAGGGAAYIMSRDSDNQAGDESASQTDNQRENTDGSPTFDAKTVGNEPYVAMMTTTSAEGEFTGVFEYDGKGNTHFNGSVAGNTMETYNLSDGSNIFCSAGTCYKTTGTQTQNDNTDYLVTDEELAAYRNSAHYLGQEPCPAGNCDVWQATEAGDMNGKVYIDTATKRVSQVTGENAGTTFKMVYEFRDVTVTPPANVQELTVPSAPSN